MQCCQVNGDFLWEIPLGVEKKRNYYVVFLQGAIKAVEDKQMSIRATSGIPYSTLNDHFHGRHNLKYGRKPGLGSDEEKLLIDGLQL